MQYHPLVIAIVYSEIKLRARRRDGKFIAADHIVEWGDIELFFTCVLEAGIIYVVQRERVYLLFAEGIVDFVDYSDRSVLGIVGEEDRHWIEDVTKNTG